MDQEKRLVSRENSKNEKISDPGNRWSSKSEAFQAPVIGSQFKKIETNWDDNSPAQSQSDNLKKIDTNWNDNSDSMNVDQVNDSPLKVLEHMD